MEAGLMTDHTLHIYRLYRAQRFYVQLLPKSMLLAILIGNGIRLQSTITLCHLQDTKVVCPFRRKSPSTKVVCPFWENPPSTKVVCPHLCSKRIGRSVT